MFLHFTAFILTFFSGLSSLPDHSSATYTIEDNCLIISHLNSGTPLILVEGGTFFMGFTDTTAEFGNRTDEQPPHQVTLDSFYIGKYEVTVSEFSQFVSETGYVTEAEKMDWSWVWNKLKWEKMSHVNWRHNVNGRLRTERENDHPVVHVTWGDALAYCNWLAQKTGLNCHLPTEAQWEFAARGGNKSKRYIYSGSNYPDDVCWYYFNSYEKTHPVGLRTPNELGICDMSGNVWEWVNDWYSSDYYERSPEFNPTGPIDGYHKAVRGGSWYSLSGACRVYERDKSSVEVRRAFTGFRIAVSDALNTKQ